MQRLKPYFYTTARPEGLYKHEVLQIINLRPEGLEVLSSIVEELDERFTDEQQEQIIEIVGDVLGRSDENEDEAEVTEGVSVGGKRMQAEAGRSP